MVRIDGNQEAVALIRMAIDDDNMVRTSQAQADVEDHVAELPNDLEPHSPERHWTFGSRSGTRLDSRELEKVFSPTNSDFVFFLTSAFALSLYITFLKTLLAMRILYMYVLLGFE